MEELLATLSAARDRESRDKKFLAAIQGIDVDANEGEGEDITDVSGYRAQQEGFGIGLGLGHIVEGTQLIE